MEKLFETKVVKYERSVDKLSVIPVSTPVEFGVFCVIAYDIFKMDVIDSRTSVASRRSKILNECVKSKQGMYLILEGDSDPIGCFSLFDNILIGEDKVPYTYLPWFGFTTQNRYKGYGSKIMKLLIEKYPRLILNAASTMKSSYYTRLGLRYIGSTSNRWDGETHLLSMVPTIEKRTKMKAEKINQKIVEYAKFKVNVFDKEDENPKEIVLSFC